MQQATRKKRWHAVSVSWARHATRKNRVILKIVQSWRFHEKRRWRLLVVETRVKFTPLLHLPFREKHFAIEGWRLFTSLAQQAAKLFVYGLAISVSWRLALTGEIFEKSFALLSIFQLSLEAEVTPPVEIAAQSQLSFSTALLFSSSPPMIAKETSCTIWEFWKKYIL